MDDSLFITDETDAADDSTGPASAPAGRLRVVRPDRAQQRMQCLNLDALIADDHPARTIWMVVERLDLSAFEAAARSREAHAGRPVTDVRLLAALWLYATTRGVGSARELARLCEEHVAYQWLCGGVSVNHHTLADFRVSHEEALDTLFTQLLARLARKNVITVERISQDGTKVRLGAGASSFKGKDRLGELLTQAKAHVEELKGQGSKEDAGGHHARCRAAQERAARERVERIEAALKEMPMIEAVRAKKNGKPSGSAPAASTTDASARKMRMGDGGTRPAANVQVAADHGSRLIVGVSVTHAGTDHGQLEPMRDQIEKRTGLKVKEHVADGGFVTLAEVDAAAAADVTLYLPVPKPRDQETDRFAIRPGDSAAVAAWRRRMSEERSKEVYKQRAALVETINGDLKQHRGLRQIAVRGLGKIKCVVIWAALAYNVMHAASGLLA